MPPRADLTGKRYGRLVAIHFVEVRRGDAIWRFQCDCGNSHTGLAINAKNGTMKSCGCLWKRGRRPFEHQHGDKVLGQPTRLYRVWVDMHRRCNNPNRRDFQWYGGRGIKVCDAWQDYPAFRKWADANGYAEDLTIDRIDPDKNYEPDNCRWLTRPDHARLSRVRHGPDGRFVPE